MLDHCMPYGMYLYVIMYKIKACTAMKEVENDTYLRGNEPNNKAHKA